MKQTMSDPPEADSVVTWQRLPQNPPSKAAFPPMTKELRREVWIMNDLPPDPESVEMWQNLPQNPPSKEALPPMTRGLRGVPWLIIILVAILIVVGLLLQRGPV
jgi:hypothetical protein